MNSIQFELEKKESITPFHDPVVQSTIEFIICLPIHEISTT
jgi:hypothetical protein